MLPSSVSYRDGGGGGGGETTGVPPPFAKELELPCSGFDFN